MLIFPFNTDVKFTVTPVINGVLIPREDMEELTVRIKNLNRGVDFEPVWSWKDTGIEVEIEYGRIKLATTYYVVLSWRKPDTAYNDGYKEYCAREPIAFVHSQCEHGGQIVELVVSPEFKGEKGDPFRFEDFTQEQLDDLQRPAIEAAETANQAATIAITAAGKADTATQSAITATSAANQAAETANQAAAKALEKAEKANTEAESAREQSAAAEQSALRANQATESSIIATDNIISVMEYVASTGVASYGIEWDTEILNPACTRIGNMELHKILPIQSRMRRCLLLDDGTVNYYLHPNDSHKKENGTPAILDGSDGMVMVEIPGHWRRFEAEGTKRRCWMSDMEMPGYHYVPKCYRSAYEAVVDRTSTPKLASVVNLAPEFRGGGNLAAEIAHDGDGGSSLGKPSTNVSLTNFRTYARNRGIAGRGGAGWNCDVYDVQKTCYWLYMVEYANLNSQLSYNLAKTAEGYRQGGLGAGVTDLVTANITAMTGGTYACIPCGASNSIGNRTGVVAYEMPVEYGENKTTYVPSYRGIENPFGHTWSWTDGCKCMIQADTDGGLSEFYTCDTPSGFTSSGVAGYEIRGLLPRANGYVKEILLGEFGENMPELAVGASATTYFSDYFSTNTPASGVTERGVLFGGHAYNSAYAGLAFAYTSYTASYTSATIGSRLCFIPD